MIVQNLQILDTKITELKSLCAQAHDKITRYKFAEEEFKTAVSAANIQTSMDKLQQAFETNLKDKGQEILNILKATETVHE